VVDAFAIAENETNKFGKQAEFVGAPGVLEHGMSVKLIYERGIS
jgi:hypothetical protein